MSLGVLAWSTIISTVNAQDNNTLEQSKARRTLKKPAHKQVNPQQRAPISAHPPDPAAASIQPAGAAATPTNGQPPLTFSGKLQQIGTRTCLAQLEQFAAASMQGVTSWNTASNWKTDGADTHAVSLFIGQRYQNNNAVPYGVTGVFAAPAGSGTCDAMSVQVVPSPLSCTQLQASILKRGKSVGELAGVPLLQDSGGQFLLVPTGTNGCVLVGTKVTYGK